MKKRKGMAGGNRSSRLHPWMERGDGKKESKKNRNHIKKKLKELRQEAITRKEKIETEETKKE